MLSSDLKLSICMSTYNRAELLRAAIANYTSNPRPDIEFVIVDNGSPDHTWAVIQDAAARGAPNRPVRKYAHLGVNRSYFRAFLEVNSPRVMFLADDDAITPGFLDMAIQVSTQFPGIGVVQFHDVLPGAPQGVVHINRAPAGPASVDLIFMASGVHPGLLLDRSKVDPNSWLLDTGIYPQVRIAVMAAVSCEAAIVHSHEKVIINENPANTIAPSRPADYGVSERMQILMDVCARLPADGAEAVMLRSGANLLAWGYSALSELRNQDIDLARRMFRALSANPQIAAHPFFRQHASSIEATLL